MTMARCPILHTTRAEICAITRTGGDAMADMGYIARIAPTGATGAQ